MGVAAPRTSGNKTQRRPRGGRCGGEGPGTTPARAPLLPRGRTHPLRNRQSPLHALQSQLRAAAARAARAASLPGSPAAPATGRVRPWALPAESALRNSNPPPASQAPRGPLLQLPAGCAERKPEATEAHEANAPIRFVLHSHFPCIINHIPQQPQETGL